MLRRSSRIVDALTAFAVLAALFALAHHLTRKWGSEKDVIGPAFVVDGDTLEVAGRRVRLAGIDAPELRQTCGAPTQEWPCGAAARTALEAAVVHGLVHCTGRANDAYHRLVAICRVGEADLASGLVRAGLALSSGRYTALEAEARATRQGIWSGPFERPVDWRAAHSR
ncbi:thermonuclease family protein [Azorhizobium sp. AG788]|uniref:thermonuclease family protein n=1 Tax=Azorhizobium sp. AG788 TaxID=2183897 RepID=UPI003139C38B